MRHGTDGSTSRALIKLFVELEGIESDFMGDHAAAGRTDKFGADFLLLLDTALDNLQFFTGKRPDRAAVTTLTGILGEPVGMRINGDMPTFAYGTLHSLISFQGKTKISSELL